jgi:hypothetical protein
MKTSPIALSLAMIFTASAASAQTTFCTGSGSSLYCTTTPGYQGHSFAQGYLGGLNVASRYAMVNAYREAHGLPRCHYGLLGAIMSASDGRPMC